MPNPNRPVSFTQLELRGLLVRLTGGDTKADPTLDLAAEKGLEKMFRAENGMNPDWRPGAKPGQAHGDWPYGNDTRTARE